MKLKNAHSFKSVGILTCAWCAGLCIGIFAAFHMKDLLAHMMRSVLHARMSIVGLFSGLLLPFFVSSLCFRYFGKRQLYAVSFFRSAVFGFISCGIQFAFRKAGWLLLLLLMWSDFWLMPVLWWYWLGHIDVHAGNLNRDTIFCIAVAFLSGIFELVYISPFLTEIIT